MGLPEAKDVGVIIGRFQIPNLHKGHQKLFEIVMSRHKRVLVLLGIPVWVGGPNNPLDYKAREQMIREAYPDITISYIKDRQTNEEWSRDVDKTIQSLYPLSKCILYGGRNGFITHYTGIFPTVETVEDPSFHTESGTEVRKNTSIFPIDSSDFRAGVIYACGNQLPSIMMCVDGAVLRKKNNNVEVLLVRKPQEINWRFPGGRLDPTDVTLEAAANREVREETGVEVGAATYVCSDGGVPDWRAIQTSIPVASALFAFPYIYGSAVGQDDVAEARWFNLLQLVWNDMEPCHRNFLAKLKEWVLSLEDKAEFFGHEGDTVHDISSAH